MFKEHEVFVLPYMFTIIIEMNDDVYTCSVQCTYSLIVYAKHPKFLQGDHVGLGGRSVAGGCTQIIMSNTQGIYSTTGLHPQPQVWSSFEAASV